MAALLPLPSKSETTLLGHDGAVMCVAFNSDGNYCLSGGQDRTVKLWNPAKGSLIKTYSAHAHAVLDVATTKDNAKIASVGGDKNGPFYWDVASGRVIRKFRGHTAKVNAVSFAADDTVLVTGSYDRSVRVWDCRSNSWDPIQSMDPFSDSVTSVRVKGTDIIAGSVDGTVRTFDLRKGQVLTDHIGQPVTAVALSNDGNCVLASQLDNRMLLLEKGSGHVLNQYTGHQNSQYQIGAAFTNTDAHVLSGSEDGEILFWDLVDAKVVHRLQGHAHVVSGVAYHPKVGTVQMLSCDVSGKVKLWTQ